MTIDALTAPEIVAALDDLEALLEDAIASGASVSFLRGAPRTELGAFWRRCAEQVEAGDRRLLLARDGERVVGTVQVDLRMPPNQPHRAEIAKLLVHTGARRRGIATRLMEAAERVATRERRTLLTLDTQEGSDAERLYASLGWTRVGVIPGYALSPAGVLAGTSLLYKVLA